MVKRSPLLVVLFAALATAPLAHAQDTPDVAVADGAPVAAPSDASSDLDHDFSVTVYDDLFARWDGTRWFIATEVLLPWPVRFQARRNAEFWSFAYQVRTIISCEKDWRRSHRKWEVDCTIDDFGMQATARRNDDPTRVQRVLDEMDDALTGAYLQLQVRDDGRVTNIGLRDVSKANSREADIHDALRTVMGRVIVGYDMRLRRYNDLSDGAWVEYNSSLMSLPAPPDSGGFRGTSTLVHKLSREHGFPTVESRGRGLLATEFDSFETTYNGVAVYDEDEGFMTERVWAMNGVPSAGSRISTGAAGRIYQHVGRLRILDNDAPTPDVGPTRQVANPGQEHPILAPWEALE